MKKPGGQVTRGHKGVIGRHTRDFSIKSPEEKARVYSGSEESQVLGKKSTKKEGIDWKQTGSKPNRKTKARSR